MSEIWGPNWTSGVNFGKKDTPRTYILVFPPKNPNTKKTSCVLRTCGQFKRASINDDVTHTTLRDREEDVGEVWVGEGEVEGVVG